MSSSSFVFGLLLNLMWDTVYRNASYVLCLEVSKINRSSYLLHLNFMIF